MKTHLDLPIYSLPSMSLCTFQTMFEFTTPYVRSNAHNSHLSFNAVNEITPSMNITINLVGLLKVYGANALMTPHRSTKNPIVSAARSYVSQLVPTTFDFASGLTHFIVRRAGTSPPQIRKVEQLRIVVETTVSLPVSESRVQHS